MKKIIKLNQTILNIKNISTYQCDRAVCGPQPNYGPLEVQRSEMMNGTKIIAAKTSGSLMIACTIMFQAGSCYETHDDLGATHFIRSASSGSGCGSSAFSKLRVLQQKGAYMTCTSDRQIVAYTLRCQSPDYDELKYYLLDAAARCCYHEWEISDRKSLVRGDLTRIHPEQRVLDLVQRACWAGPLANSIFCEDERVDPMTGAMLRSYAQSNFKSSHCSVASVGLPFEETITLAGMVYSNTEKPPPTYHQTPSRPRGGIEYYDLGPGSDTWIAVAASGCGTDNLENLFIHAILASACGADNMTEGQHKLDRTPRSPLRLMCGDDIFTDYRAFNISYADSGTFGILAKTRAATAGKVGLAASKFLADLGRLNSKQIEDGKKRLLVNLAFHDEDIVKVSEGFALQAANGVVIDNVESANSMIDSIYQDDIIRAAKALSEKNNKMAIAVVGDICSVATDLFK